MPTRARPRTLPVVAIVIIKLGGSVLSHKRSGRAVLRTRVVRAILDDLARLRRRQPQLRCVLLHGAGSFGHPLAYRYGLVGGQLGRGRSTAGYVTTLQSIRQLANDLAAIGHRAGLPIVPLQASAITVRTPRRTSLLNLPLIRTLLAHDLIPLLGGDVLVDRRGRTSIVSADDLAVSLARAFNSKTLVFLTDVDGVIVGHRRAPARRLGRRDLERLTARHRTVLAPHDVTGGMLGKLAQLLALRRRRVIVGSGLRPASLSGALSGRSGTTISL